MHTVVGVNVENRSYGVSLCAECGMVGPLTGVRNSYRVGTRSA